MNKEELSPGIVIYKDAIKDRAYLLDLMKKVNYDEIGGARDVGICYIKQDSKETTLFDIEEILESSFLHSGCAFQWTHNWGSHF